MYRPRAGLASRVAAKGIPTPAATTQAQPSNAAVPATQSTPTAPLSEAPKAPPAPKGLFDLPSYTPGPGGDPRDATYWANLAKLRFGAEQEYSKGLFEQQRADTGYNDALQIAIRNRSAQQRGLGESAIRGNLGNSGWLDRSEAEDTTAYTQERASAQLGKTEEDAAREATRKGILQGYSLEAAAELGEAAARLAQRRQEEAEQAEGLGEGEAGAAAAGGSVGSGYMSPGGHIAPWKPKKPKYGVGPAKPVVRAALSQRRRVR